MTTQNRPEFIHFCDDCDIEYVGEHCAPCPLCPLSAQFRAARLEARRSEPYLLLTHNEPEGIETLLNDTCADDWDLMDIKVGHEEDRDNGRPLFVAVLRREHYDHARRQAAVEARQKASVAHQEKRAEMESETAAMKAARSGRA